MKILVTGYKGFIGQNMVKALETEHEVSGFEWDEPFSILGFDLVIHLGAISSTSETNVDKVMLQNYDFSVLLIETCNMLGIDFQYASSASVYGLGIAFKETSPTDPRTPYAWSKYMFDRYVLNKVWDIKVQGFRYFNVYGPHEDHKGDQASPYHKFTKQAETTGTIVLFEGSENFKRDFVPVSQIVDTHKAFFSIKESGIWNLGTGISKSFFEVAEEVSKLYNVQYKFIKMPEIFKNSYQKYTCSDNSKINNTLKAKYVDPKLVT